MVPRNLKGSRYRNVRVICTLDSFCLSTDPVLLQMISRRLSLSALPSLTLSLPLPSSPIYLTSPFAARLSSPSAIWSFPKAYTLFKRSGMSFHLSAFLSLPPLSDCFPVISPFAPSPHSFGTKIGAGTMHKYIVQRGERERESCGSGFVFPTATPLPLPYPSQ